MGKWIWINEDDRDGFRENTRACFADTFLVGDAEEEITLEICAVTKYMVYVNGCYVGRGPIRGEKGSFTYDSYSILPLCRTGENTIAIRVWNYGWSTYQSISDTPGVDFTVAQGERILVQAGETTKCKEDLGYMRYAPKRNVNLGFSDYYDGRKGNLKWILDSEEINSWGHGKILQEECRQRQKKSRPIRMLHSVEVYPKKVECIQDVKRGCQQLTLNTRRAFFGDRRDADETIFAGFLGGCFIAEEDMEGMISFPNRTWNGIIGTFRLGDKIYPVDNAHRDIPVKIQAGEQFFLMQISGKFDDLYSHIELRFPQKLGRKGFFVVGPTQRICQKLDGVSRIYGGLDEFNEMESYTKKHQQIFEAGSLEELKNLTEDIVFLDEKDIFEDMYLLSLARTEEVVKEYGVKIKDCGILWKNQSCTVIDLPKEGDYRRILVDFGNICVGQLSFTLKAAEGTIIDIYGFENYYRREIDFTIGLNNGVRYVTAQGWQTYECMARTGMRYALITVRNATEPVQIRDFHMCHETYALSSMGQFESSDTLLNRIFEMCRDTNRFCTEDCFTDSPTYEQAFWTGDAQLSSLINGWLFGDYEYAVHVQKLAVTAQNNTMMMNALTPTDWNTSIPMWMMNWVLSVFETEEISGSREHIEELYPYIYRVLDFYRQFITLNRIFEMCRDTNRFCTEDCFTDSPTYEQAFWTGDAQLSSLINGWLFGDYEYAVHVQKLAVTAQNNTMMMNALTPTDWNTSIPMWMMNWVLSVFETEEISGSREHIEELYPYIYRVLDFYRQFITADGGFLINAWNMIDWAAMDIGNHGVVTAHQAQLAYCYRIFGNYCKGTGREEEGKKFLEADERLLEYIDRFMWDKDKKMYLDGWSPEKGISSTVSIQTHIMLYLYNGIKGEDKKELVKQYLLTPPAEFLEVGSPFMLYYLYQAYVKAGKRDIIFEDIKKRWGEMLKYDSTTCWEVFPGFYENGRTRSYCHSWSASPAAFMLQHLSGIRILEDGFRKITFETCPIALQWCRSSIPTPYGMISIDWYMENGVYDVRMEVPEQIEFVPCKEENVRIQIKYLK